MNISDMACRIVDLIELLQSKNEYKKILMIYNLVTHII